MTVACSCVSVFAMLRMTPKPISNVPTFQPKTQQSLVPRFWNLPIYISPPRSSDVRELKSFGCAREGLVVDGSSETPEEEAGGSQFEVCVEVLRDCNWYESWLATIEKHKFVAIVSILFRRGLVDQCLELFRLQCGVLAVWWAFNF